LFAYWLLNPRELTAHWLALIRTTSSPGTVRSSSGRLVNPERRMSSCVMTEIAAGDSLSLVSFFETAVTGSFMSCSMVMSARPPGGFWAGLSAAPVVAASSNPSAVRIQTASGRSSRARQTWHAGCGCPEMAFMQIFLERPASLGKPELA
jgi:hypothetical protein